MKPLTPEYLKELAKARNGFYSWDYVAGLSTRVIELEAERRREFSMSEHQEQSLLFLWAKINVGKYPELAWLFAVPNGGYRMVKTARDLKAEGVKKGVPDVWFPISGVHGEKPVKGLVIEMKFGKNKPTPEQEAWLDFLAGVGWRTEVCYCWEAAARVICEHCLISFEDVGLRVEDSEFRV